MTEAPAYRGYTGKDGLKQALLAEVAAIEEERKRRERFRILKYLPSVRSERQRAHVAEKCTESSVGLTSILFAPGEPELARAAMVMADWHPVRKLTDILGQDDIVRSRHEYQSGVYMIAESHYRDQPGNFVPVYIGMSSNLSQRLSTYAKGKSGNPVNKVANDHLLKCSKQEEQVYLKLTPLEQQTWRKRWMEERELYIKVAHTENLIEARKLEKLLIRLYSTGRDHELWNSMLYLNTPPFPAPREMASA